jgi:ABC-2 type transport system ATP-binding protein
MLGPRPGARLRRRCYQFGRRMTTRALELRAVTKAFGAKTCLRGLDLVVEQGTVYGFLGPNGAGKTTTIRIVLGLLVPDGGEVRVYGHDLYRSRARRSRSSRSER